MAVSQVALSRSGLSLVGEDDIPTNMRIPYGDKNEIIAQREDPYGFWKITLKVGATPKELQGVFSTNRYAEQAIKTFLDKKAV